MILWLLQVYTVVAVIYGGSSVSDAFNPRGFPFALSSRGHRGLSGPKEGEIDQLNDYITKYLFFFERMRQSGVNDHVKQAMYVVKLHIIQSWLSTLHPDTGVLSTPKSTTVTDVKLSIIKTIKAMEPIYVNDHILYYINTLEPFIKDHLEVQKTSFKYSEKLIFNEEKFFAENNDYEATRTIETSWNDILEEMNEIRSNIIIHRISTQMLLQSYIKNFSPSQANGKITIISSDGLTDKEFDVPAEDSGIYTDFKQIGVEFDEDVKGNDKIKDIVYSDILNERIKNYLLKFDELMDAETSSNHEAMKIVKNLMLQGWIETMNPAPQFLPVEPPQTLDILRVRLVRDIKKHSQVGDKVLQYITNKEESIEDEFYNLNDTLADEYRNKRELLKNLKETPENMEEIKTVKQELKDLNRDINVQNDYIVAHSICKQFYLDSFRKDFISEDSPPETFTIKTSRFTVPVPIQYNNFYSDFIAMDLE